MKPHLSFLGSLFFAIYFLFFPPSFLFAQGISLQISPILYETNASPGELKTISDFEFFNPFDTPQKVKVKIQDIVISDESDNLIATVKFNEDGSWTVVYPTKESENVTL